MAIFWNRAVGPGELEVLDLKAAVCKKAEMSGSQHIQDSLNHEEDDSVVGGLEPFLARDFLTGNESFLISVR